MSARNIVRSIGIIAVCVLGIILAPALVYEFEYAVPDFVEPVVSEHAPPPSIFFVGDIMLGRNVETLMAEFGMQYPFQNVLSLLNGSDLTIGNFEGIVSKEHVQTPSMTFQFSIKQEHLKQLQENGFDILSLANNHSNDYGKSALSHTRALCLEYKIICGGTPTDFDEYSLLIKKINDKKIGFIFVYAVYVTPDIARMTAMIEALSAETDIQIAYVHWGDEYTLTHSKAQESLAMTMIDNGIDAVIGHHPHVVQDIALYKNKPIFYSLGNFIFDQYFSDDVQEGLGVALSITDTKTLYSLVPFTSLGTRAQPREMDGDDRQTLFNRVLGGLRGIDGVDIENGSLTVQNIN